MALDVEKVVGELSNLSVLELVSLKEALEEKWGVSAAAAVAVAAPAAPAGGDGAAEVEEKSTFDVVLTGAGQSKIPVIKVIRAATGLGLREAKELADTAPKPVKEGLARDEAEALKKELEDAGASVELK